MLIKLACVVANAYVEIYYRLILSIFLDYSFTHMALNIRNCIIRILACKSHQVKIHNWCINGEHSFMKLCQVDTLYIFAVFKIGIALLELFLHLLVQRAIP